ncbi:MAG TPA: signal peptidase I [Steroidobacteraceae bacterium]|nr:signal peptidase I [Steroidobacteraceae bacterium]
MLLQISTVLAWLAIPVGLLAILDDWILRPRRRLAALPGQAADPGWAHAAYLAMPVVVVGAIVRIVMSEQLDFSLVLVLVLLVSGVVWIVDRALLAPARQRAAQQANAAGAVLPLPVTVDYARSFLPVAALVLVLRGFIFEPFRIPSDSMMPTLEQGDFLVVNKFAYGLRIPVLNRKFLDIGEPQRGEVVVFRYPPHPEVNFIKRVVGLPGDTVRVRNDQLIINGVPVPMNEQGRYNDGCYQNMRLEEEVLGAHRHQVLSCRTSGGLFADKSPACNRDMDHSYLCVENTEEGLPDANDTTYDRVVPPGQYLMIGDNRDNSSDGRVWGFVPEDHLVGRASRIWLNLPLGRSGWPDWHRFGKRIE